MKTGFRFCIYSTLVALLLFTTMACGDSGDKKSQKGDISDPVAMELRALEKAVIDVHDEVMPKMAELNNKRVKLLSHYGDENLSTEKRNHLSRAIMHLEEADSLMWAWMHNYNRPDYGSNLDTVRSYLENEMVTVTTMRDKFLSSMEEGEALLKKYREDVQ